MTRSRAACTNPAGSAAAVLRHCSTRAAVAIYANAHTPRARQRVHHHNATHCNRTELNRTFCKGERASTVNDRSGSGEPCCAAQIITSAMS